MTLPEAFTLALQHQQAGRLGQAEALYRQVLEVEPNHAHALHYLGVLANEVGRHEVAVGLIERAIRIEPNSAASHSNLGQVYHAKGQLDEAIAAYRRALSINPNLPQIHANLGRALRDRKELDAAGAAYRRALEIKPDYTEAWNNLGTVLRDQRRSDESTAAYLRAADLAPNHPDIQNNLGAALMDGGRWEEAIAALRNALRLKPDYAVAHHNLGSCLAEQGRLGEAAGVLREAIRLHPDHAEMHNSLGTVLQEEGDLDGALGEYRRALELQPDCDGAKLNLSLLLLRKGDFERGWPLHEARWSAFRFPEREFRQPRWNGGPLDGQRLLLHAEQGLGDTIQFIRYAPLLSEKGATVMVECQPGLKELLGSVEGVSQAVEYGQPLPDFDLHCPMMSLPLAFGTRVETIPAAIPYLHADEGKSAQWRERLEGQTMKIGLVWAGGVRPHQPNSLAVDRRRSMRLSQFALLAGIPGLVFVSLQKGPAAAQATTPPEGMTLLDWTDELHDFSDTAALVEALDLVIGVDTAVAHLAGALGKPVWMLSRFDGCWRWLLDREDSPWYPTTRLFRQPAPGDWDSVIERVAREFRGQQSPLPSP